MRIGQKIFLVGGIPIAIAAAIAIAAVFLQGEAERARNGAVLAGTIYRNVLGAVTERDRYIDALPGYRDRHLVRFAVPTKRAELDLDALDELTGDPDDRAAIAEARHALGGYVAGMSDLAEVTAHNDAMIMDMRKRANRLVDLTEEARQRQHDSNADIVAALSDRDGRVRAARNIVDAAYALRAAVAAVAIRDGEGPGAGRDAPLFGALPQLGHAAEGLVDVLNEQGMQAEADTLSGLVSTYEGRARAALSASSAGDGEAGAALDEARQDLTEWSERLLKIHSTEYRSLHDEMAELLTYSVRAHETEQATQNVAIAVLRLGEDAATALDSRRPAATAGVLEASDALSETIARLPISPLIQSEMIDAFDQWREGLATTTDGLSRQNALIADMDGAAHRMIEAARSLDARFTSSAEAIGRSIRTVLILGAAIGLIFGAVTGVVVARSITAPLKRLQQGMLNLAGDPHRGRIEGEWSRDELGDMANATNVFVGEILRREEALRRAKNRADEALAELRRTQGELVQAEKLASLGQLVAGVAHEINTPLGIALTTSTVLEEEVKTFRQEASSGRLARPAFERFTARMDEGARLLYANLSRAADLVQAFKQVAADQASGERRTVDMRTWLNDLLTSLGPMLRKAGHEVSVECPETFVVETSPGPLAQILTNLLTNSIAHAYAPDEHGRIAINVSAPDPGTMRIVFVDDGRGIEQQNLAKIFDPFFTTGRSRGSTGLGLHIVYNLVTSTLQGRVNVESTPGEGTRFTIDIPVGERTPDGGEAAGAQQSENVA